MAKQPILKTTVTDDKTIIELSHRQLVGFVEAYNRRVRKTNREDPTAEMPTYRVTDPKKLAALMISSWIAGRGVDSDKLPELFAFVTEDVLEEAVRQKAAVELPLIE